MLSLVNELGPMHMQANVRVRKFAMIVKDLNPEPAPTNEARLFISLLNSVLYPVWGSRGWEASLQVY